MTDPAHWSLVKARLAEVLAAPEPERGRLLRRLDPETRREVLTLLGAYDTAGAFLTQPAVDAGGTVRRLADAVSESDPLVGQHVGPWLVRARIGEGGMGTVYRAERADGLFERTVALKVVRGGPASGPAADELRRRFDAERRLLAGLDHPGIARLFDGGTLRDGQPWLAMEYVEGVPITQWADQHALSTRARIRLFLQVLDALAHAHRHLVVHRDLKPPHVVVEADVTGNARTCVLDFGVAVALGVQALADEPHTARYAAPEQLAGEPATTSADVFALGLLLFELLAGDTPERDAAGHVLQRASDVAPRGSALRGDLDAILARALSSTPSDRYPTAEAFAADLRRHLAHRPVEARRQRAGYLLGRFVRRNRLAVAVAALGVLAVVALGAYHTAAITAERNAAQREAAKAQATASFLADVFRTYNPDAEIGDRASARELLDARVARIQADPDDPATPALLDAAARAYAGLALYEAADPLAAQALALRRADPTTRPTELLRSLLTLAEMRLWTERYPSADSLSAEALLLTERSGSAADRATALRTRARFVAVALGYAHADSLLRASLAIQRDHLPPDDPALAATLHDYGASLVYSSQEAPAVLPLREALRIRRARLGPSHPHLAETLTLLGAALLASEDDRSEAVRLLTEADRIFAETLDRAHPEAATALMNLGHAARRDGRLADALAYYDRGLALRKQILGTDHQTVAASHNNMGYVEALDGDYDTAFTHYNEARRILDNSFPGGHVRTTYQLVAMGKMRRLQGRFRESERFLRQALSMRQRVASHRPRLIARAQLHLAATLLPLGQREEARQLLGAATPLLDHPDDLDWRTLHETLSLLHAQGGDSRRAAHHAALAEE